MDRQENHSEIARLRQRIAEEYEEVVDMELHCVSCGTRLYIPAPQGSALRKGPHSRKVDKCGTVFA